MNYVGEKSHMDYDKKEKEINQTISRINECSVVYELLYKGLKKYDGKKITKRITTPLREAGYTVHYEPDQWSISVSVWGKYIPFADRYLFSFTCDARDGRIFDLEKFRKKYHRHCTEETAVMIKKYEKILEQLVELVVEYNLAIDDFNDSLKKLREAENNFSIVD